MKIAYFVNQYPKVSHSFIRREILALERLDFSVERFAIRGWDAEVVDEQDQAEQQKTRYLLKAGYPAIVGAFVKTLLHSPAATISAFAMAFKLGWRADRPLLFHIIYFFEACLLNAWLNEEQVEHVHGHFGTNSAEILLLVNRLGGPAYSFTVHGPEEFDKPASLKLSEKIRYSKFVAAISSFGKSQLFRTIDHDQWDKIKEIHCGLEKDFYAVDTQPVSSPDRFVCVGRLCEQKGQLLLIDAANELAKRNIDFKLVLAGDGELRQEIEKQIKHYQLEDKVTITGWISAEQVREEILKSRALVLPSFAEGLPVVIMEAMSLKRVALSTYIAGIPELIIPGQNGWLFPAGSVEALLTAMEECLKTPLDQLSAMGEAGYERVLERHSIDTEASKLAGYFAR